MHMLNQLGLIMDHQQISSSQEMGNFYTCTTTSPPATNLAMAFLSPTDPSRLLGDHAYYIKYRHHQQPRAIFLAATAASGHDLARSGTLIRDQKGFHTKTSSSSSSSNQVLYQKASSDRDQTLSPSCDHSPDLVQHNDKLMGYQKTAQPAAAAVALPHSQPAAASSLRKSTDPNLWAWGQVIKDGKESKTNKSNNMDDHHHRHGDHLVPSHGHGRDHVGVSPVRMKKMKARRKMREPRFCFKTMSDVDVLDDGYKWRKYGQKVVKNTQHPRSYYRCTKDNCRVKKRVERLADDPRMVITTYEGRHAHSPPRDQDQDESHDKLHLNSFFW